MSAAQNRQSDKGSKQRTNLKDVVALQGLFFVCGHGQTAIHFLLLCLFFLSLFFRL